MRPTLTLATLIIAGGFVGCGSSPPHSATPASNPAPSQPPPADAAPQAAPAATNAKMGPTRAELPNGLIIEDLAVGTGPGAKSGDRVSVDYDGKLLGSAESFDDSYSRGKPLTFELGTHQVIAGWEQGLEGMKVGGKRKLTIPPALGYGARGARGAIPPNSTLVFTVEMVEIEPTE